MASVLTSVSQFPRDWTAADMQSHLGVPLERIRMVPPPGTATTEDLVRNDGREDFLCELVDGVLVEKALGYYESRVAVALILFLDEYLRHHDLGIVLDGTATLQILPKQVRLPDVSFLSWRHFPNRKLPDEPVPSLAPDLAVEILSASNTSKEMDRKLRDYFAAGVLMVWYIDPQTQSAEAYTAPDEVIKLGSDDALDGGEVLPGFKVSLQELFERAGYRNEST